MKFSLLFMLLLPIFVSAQNKLIADTSALKSTNVSVPKPLFNTREDSIVAERYRKIGNIDMLTGAIAAGLGLCVPVIKNQFDKTFGPSNNATDVNKTTRIVCFGLIFFGTIDFFAGAIIVNKYYKLSDTDPQEQLSFHLNPNKISVCFNF